MSCNAHRIDEVKYAKHTTFSVWHDNVMDVLIAASNEKAGYIHDLRNSDGDGILEVPVTLLETVLKNEHVSPDVKAAIKKDIAFAKKRNNSIVQYDCF